MKKALAITLMIACLVHCSRSDDKSATELAGIFLFSPLAAGTSTLSVAVPGEEVSYYSGSHYDFGGTAIGQTSTPVEFSISNRDSDTNLILHEISLDGPAAADFTITPPSSTNLAPGESTEFSVQYAPGAVGNRDATITVKSNDEDKPEYKVHLTGSPGVEVHMVGRYRNDGMYRKNKELIKLPSLDATKQTNPTSIQVSGADVYIAGFSTNSSNIMTAVYWKNGTLNQLPIIDGSRHSSANDVLISGADVYIAGYSVNSSGQAIAVYWKNGVKIELPTLNAVATSVFISGGDVYVGGSYRNGSVTVPAYWKNGTLVSLPPLFADTNARVSDISVSGSDVYASGTAVGQINGDDQSVYWKNGIITLLGRSIATFQSSAPALHATGTDLHILIARRDTWGPAGHSIVYHNGAFQSLEKAPNRNHYNPRYTNVDAPANSMFVFGDDVYSVGTHYRAALWKNEKLIQFSGLTPSDIFVTGP